MNTANLLEVDIIAFGYKYGPAPQANLLLDVRYLKNPFYEEHLKPLTGLDEAVQRYIDTTNPGFRALFESHIEMILAGYLEFGHDHIKVTFAFGCTGGKHRSRYCAYLCAQVLKRFVAERGLKCTHTLSFRDEGKE